MIEPQVGLAGVVLQQQVQLENEIKSTFLNIFTPGR